LQLCFLAWYVLKQVVAMEPKKTTSRSSFAKWHGVDQNVLLDMSLDEFVELFRACAHHKYAPLLHM